MSLELRDLRTKVTAETDVALEAEARARGLDKAEVGREVLEAWARQRIHAATILTSALKREGLSGASQGKRGSDD